MTERLAASGVLRELSLQVDGPVVHPAELGQQARGGPEQVVLTEATAEAGPLPPDVPGAGTALRRVPGLGQALLAVDGLRGLDALAERRLHEGASLALGLDTGTPEGLGAAQAYHEALTATRGVAFSRWGSAVDYASLDGAVDGAGPGAAKVAAEAAALVELAHPGTFHAATAGEPEAVARLEDAMRAAQGALEAGRLRPAEDLGWSEGWVETYPELTDAERQLGQLPGFVSEAALPWTEELPAAQPDLLPPHTGHGGLDGLGLDEPLVTVAPDPSIIGNGVVHTTPSPFGPGDVFIEPDRARHILDGDRTGGGHRAGTGAPNKTEFPAAWTDGQVLDAIKAAAESPRGQVLGAARRPGELVIRGDVDGVTIQVVVRADGGVRTAWPTQGPGVIKN